MKTSLAALFLTLLAGHASATLYVYEPFDYTAGVDNLNGQNGGTGFDGAWASNGGSPDVQAGSLSYTDAGNRQLVQAGNKGFWDATSPTAVAAGVTSSSFRTVDVALNAVTGSTIYFSFMGQQTVNSQRAANFAIFAGTAEAVSVGHGTNFAPNWAAFTGGNGANGAASTVSMLDSSLLVLRIDVNANGDNERIRLYVNPPLNAEPGTAQVDFSDRNALAAVGDITRIRPLAGNSNGTLLAAPLLVDEIRIGDTWGDVTPHVVIPEPGTSALLGLAALRLFRRRRN